MRAVGVYEWTGDMAKPAASRLIPGLALHRRQAGRRRRLPRAARPVRARHRQCLRDRPGRHCAGHARPGLRAPPGRPSRRPPPPYDDGWFGYGKFVPPTPPKSSTLKPAKTLGVINGLDEDDDRPHFSARSAQPGSGDAATPTAGAPASSTGTPASDPDRPTLHRTTSSSDQTASSSSGETPANDPDRPTLRRRSPQMRRTPGRSARRDGRRRLAERRPQPASAASRQARQRAERGGHPQAGRPSLRPGPPSTGRRLGCSKPPATRLLPRLAG